MILCLDNFVFTARLTSFQTLTRDTEWRVSEHKRVGERPLLQYVGPGADKISIDGVLYPQTIELNALVESQILSKPFGTKGAGALERVRGMAEAGRSYTLVDQFGWVYGLWAISSLQETQSHFLCGSAQKIEFTISLVRDEDQALSTGRRLKNYAEGLLQ